VLGAFQASSSVCGLARQGSKSANGVEYTKYSSGSGALRRNQRRNSQSEAKLMIGRCACRQQALQAARPAARQPAMRQNTSCSLRNYVKA